MLNDGFTEYLEKRKEDGTANKIAKKGKKKNDFVEDSLTGKPFEDFYEIGDELGEGGYAFVYRCFHKRTNKTYAVKEVVLSKMESGGESTLKDEIDLYAKKLVTSLTITVNDTYKKLVFGLLCSIYIV